MILAHNKPNKQKAESDRIEFYQRFAELKKSDDVDKPYLSYTPSYQYPRTDITETKYQHDQQPA